MVIDTLVVGGHNALAPERYILANIELFGQDAKENLVNLSLKALDGLNQLYQSRLTNEKIEMRYANTPLVGKIDDFGIFAEDYNLFEFKQIFWNNLVTNVVFYPFLYVSFVFLSIVYFFIDLFYILTFNFTVLDEKLISQGETYTKLLTDIVTVPY